MEVILTLAGIWFAFWLLGGALRAIGAAAKSAVATVKGEEPPARRFEARVSQTTIELKGNTAPIFEIEVRGPITAPYAGFEIQFVVHAMDITDGEAKPIFCALDWMQEADTPLLEYRTEAAPLPYQHAIISDWSRRAFVPIDMVSLPRSGTRRLEFHVDVVSANPEAKYFFGQRVSGVVLASATVRTSVEWAEIGYEEMRERRTRIEELTLDLAMAVSAADGSMDRAEGAVIRAWLGKRVEAIEDDEEKSREKRRLNGLVTAAYQKATAGELDMRAMCSELTEISDPAGRYDALELCLHVAAADGRAEEAELNTIRQLGEWMRVSLDRLRGMEEKILPVSMHVGDADDDGLLGISGAMSPEEVRKHLNREYRKWNSLASHSDPSKREQAQEMLSRIAAARRKHVA
ncbi:TerB family tellurite resistance protein [Thioalkalivibrio sp. XN8]|uniref:TerB family tellurite resistance protein n=1 Tax=Thioalkalivibrio sp. XN8 TaxID=2712863 RepID=UPI0013ECD3C1|nr:TerB family tellurite resistance protein [Thioalkalivibrio sp. XN8]NGP53584.1 TerB family tellurite resistance protein [Thioalkalivibrio sp. XN8]